MDLASPAVSGTSVYANGLTPVAALQHARVFYFKVLPTVEILNSHWQMNEWVWNIGGMILRSTRIKLVTVPLYLQHGLAWDLSRPP